MKKVKVAIEKGDEYSATAKALNLIKEQILAKVEKEKIQEIFLKPNWVMFQTDWLPITKTQTIKAIIDFFNLIGEFKITVGDASPIVFGWDTKMLLERTDFLSLEKEYRNVKVVDLNDYPAEEKFLAKTLDGPKSIRYFKPILESQFLVSIAKIKTHDTFANTLSLKNVASGCAHGEDKFFLHGLGSFPDNRRNDTDLNKTIMPMVHYNFYQGSKAVYPDLAVIDGVVAMEGNGPVHGTPVNLGIALASVDPLSADIVATRIMGIDPREIIYSDILKDELRPNFETVGEDPNQFKHEFKLSNYQNRPHTTKQEVLNLINN
ncbi:MAG: DUF362 domain-containing protein [Patescibacteria group bacterium]|jgi:uncharacterized protein (DUF362 family)